MMRWPVLTLVILCSFVAGFATHLLYRRWNPAVADSADSDGVDRPPAVSTNGAVGQSFRVNFVPLAPPLASDQSATDVPVIAARDVEKIRTLAGRQARVRGRIFRVGHSAKSNTYFLNFGPTREALTAVIFASTVELFEKNRAAPKNFENKEVELTGQIKDHPQFGLELILEDPGQIKILN
jgi:hypothetical protein